MAYVTGSANSLTDLLTAIQNACTSNGWTLSGSVLHKGTCYMEVKVAGSFITLRGGRGIDGSNALTNATDRAVGNLGIVSMGVAFAFPMTYFIHVLASPDEVYVVVNYGVNYYQTLGFGQSAMPGLAGSGNWYCGPTISSSVHQGFNVPQSAEYDGTGGSFGAAFSLFCRENSSGAVYSRGVDHGLDGSNTWAELGCKYDWTSLYWRQPNQWNSESILIPIRVYASRPSGFISPVLECAHARQVNIANVADQQIITLGSDKWKVYPWWSRGATNTRVTADSGLGGHAIRYDGS